MILIMIDDKQLQGEGSFPVSCFTCKVSKVFYSKIAVANFKLQHLGHDVRQELVSFDSAVKETKGVEGEAKSEVKESKKVALSKLAVELTSHGPHDVPVFKVLGVQNDGIEAFTLSFPIEQRDELRKLIKSGSYTKKRFGDTISFTWSEKDVQISREAMKQLSSQEVKEKRAETKMNQATERNEGEVQKIEEKVVQQAHLIAKEKKERVENLLLARSYYIQEGEDYREEAIRISKVLKEFRWKIEPSYSIRVIFDDNICIEGNNGIISRKLIKRIESLGYRLTAVSVEGPSPTAWFKRRQAQMIQTQSKDESELRRRLEEKEKELQAERAKYESEKAKWEERFLALVNLLKKAGIEADLKQIEQGNNSINQG